MLILKHLKTLQHVSIIIQIIFREFVGSLLKSLNLKFNCQRLNVVMRQHGYMAYRFMLTSWQRDQDGTYIWHIPIVVCTVLDSWWWTEKLSEIC